MIGSTRFNSNMVITKRKGKFNCENYTSLLVFSDGSTAEIRYKEPRALIKVNGNVIYAFKEIL